MKRIDDRPFLVCLSIALIIIIMVCGLAMEYGWFGYSAEMVETPISVVVVSEGADASNFALVNVNTADETLLETLPRIGPTLAKQIVEYRETHGTFRSIEELKSVKGIGEKVLEDIRPYITIES